MDTIETSREWIGYRDGGSRWFEVEERDVEPQVSSESRREQSTVPDTAR